MIVTIQELVRDGLYHKMVHEPEVNPLTEEAAREEAQLVDGWDST